jgi:DNA mismatch repair protein MutS
MIQQYLTVKKKYDDAILFFRMGDFYEMFFEDAEAASKILEITLTSRNKRDKKPIPMCGVPVRAVQGYISRLIDRGYKVAICDQVEDPATAKGLVKRDVVRVITPGMIVENELLDEKTNNYLLAITHSDQLFGIAYLDISTGTFRVTESPDLNAVSDELLRISPREVLVTEASQLAPFWKPLFGSVSENAITYLNEKAFDYARSYDQLIDQFKTLTLEGFGCENLKVGVRAAGAVVFYVRETQKQKLEHISKIESYRLDHYLMVDNISCRNLELIQNIRSGTRKGTLIGIIDRTATAMGARLLRRWIRYPLVETEEIKLRFNLRFGTAFKQDYHGTRQCKGFYSIKTFNRTAPRHNRAAFTITRGPIFF